MKKLLLSFLGIIFSGEMCSASHQKEMESAEHQPSKKILCTAKSRPTGFKVNVMTKKQRYYLTKKTIYKPTAHPELDHSEGDKENIPPSASRARQRPTLKRATPDRNTDY